MSPFFAVCCSFIFALITSLESTRVAGDHQPTLRVTSILVDQFLKYRRSIQPLPGNERFEGYIVDLLNLLAWRVGFNYEITLVKDNRYGSPTANGTWNGMVGELTRGEADIAAAPLTITATRSHVVDFTIPFMSYTLGALVQRNHAVQPEIRHLSDLARQSAIKYGVIEGGSTEHFFRYSTITSYAEMWRQMHADEAAGRVLTIAEGVNRVMSSPADRPWAFIGESYTLNYHAGLSYCRLKVVQDDVIQRYLGLALPLNSQLRGRLDTAVLMLLEEGELAKLQMKWWYRQFQCDRLPNN